MALTQNDITAIKKALEPEFAGLGTSLKAHIDKRVKESEDRMISEMSQVVNDAFGLVGDQITDVKQQIAGINRRFDTLRIESNT